MLPLLAVKHRKMMKLRVKSQISPSIVPQLVVQRSTILLQKLVLQSSTILLQKLVLQCSMILIQELVLQAVLVLSVRQSSVLRQRDHQVP